jgi:hypothetical protein
MEWSMPHVRAPQADVLPILIRGPAAGRTRAARLGEIAPMRAHRILALTVLAATAATLLSAWATPSPIRYVFGQYDTGYLGRRFFFLVDPVDPLATGELVPPDDPAWVPPPEIHDLLVWRDDFNQTNNGASVEGFVYLDPNHVEAPNDSTPPDSLAGYFDLLAEDVDYVLRTDLVVHRIADPSGNEQIYRYPVLDMLEPFQFTGRLGVTFRAVYTIDGASQEVVYGDLPVGADPLRAKALSIPAGYFDRFEGDYFSPEDFWYPIRLLELRNIYQLGGINDEDWSTFALVVRSAINGNDYLDDDPDVTFLRMLGLDRLDAEGNPGFDHQIDDGFIIWDEELVVMPDLRPFAPAAVDSVWSPYWSDLDGDPADPAVRPARFAGEHANRVPYDKRFVVPREDRLYFVEARATLYLPPLLVFQARPNPFHGTTTIPIQPGQFTDVTVKVYGADGRHVATLLDGAVPWGSQAIEWDGRHDNDVRATSGVYFIEVRGAGVVERVKVLLLK